MGVKLTIGSMKDFGPEAVAEQVPELKKLLELREAIKSLKSPMSNVPPSPAQATTVVSRSPTISSPALTPVAVDAAVSKAQW